MKLQVLVRGGWRLLALILLMLAALPAHVAGCAQHDVRNTGPAVVSAPLHDHHAAHGGIGCTCAASAVLPSNAPTWRTPATPGAQLRACALPLPAGRSVPPDTPPPIA